MRWERLFAELEGQLEHTHVEERDALVADLREGEWAARSWLDGLQDASAVDLDVIEVGVLSGRARFANAEIIHLAGDAVDQVIATHSVRWARGATKAPGPGLNAVAARLGWGHVLREMKDDDDEVRFTLAGGVTVEGRISAVGRDFVRVAAVSGSLRDVPTRAIVVVTTARVT